MEDGINKVKTPEIKTFPKSFIEETIRSLLESPEAKTKISKIVKNPKIWEFGNNEQTLKTTIEASGFNIKLETTLGSKGNTLFVKNYNIETSFFAKGKAEKGLVPYINKIPEILKKHVEEKEGRKVEKIEIINGGINVTFANVIKAQSQVIEFPQSAPAIVEKTTNDKEVNKDEPILEAEFAEDEDAEKAAAMEKLLKIIENCKRILAKNETKREALLRELAELNAETEEPELVAPQIPALSEEEENIRDIESEMRGIETEIMWAKKGIQNLSFFNFLESRRLKKEIISLTSEYDLKRTELENVRKELKLNEEIEKAKQEQIKRFMDEIEGKTRELPESYRKFLVEEFNKLKSDLEYYNENPENLEELEALKSMSQIG
jgi:hypothetical protein